MALLSDDPFVLPYDGVVIGSRKYHETTLERNGTHAKGKNSGSFLTEKEDKGC